MKRIISKTAVCITTLLILFSIASAEEKISVYIDGSLQDFPKAPYTEEDRTLVPMRAIFETLGCSVLWDGDTETVTAQKGGKVISMKIDSPLMYVDGAEVILDVPPRLSEDTTFVPLRALSEALDCRVTWSGDTNSVYVITEYIPTYPEYDSVPDFGQIAGITPNPVLSEGRVRCYSNATAEDAEKYRSVMESQGFFAVDGGEYMIYTKGDLSVLAGFRDGVFRIVITDY